MRSQDKIYEPRDVVKSKTMSLRKQIFDSNEERKLFNHLNSMWKSNFNIYPQLPFLKIFNINDLELTPNEKKFLFKTNIDYTICDKYGKPLMCIEFDGIGHGYSWNGKYVQFDDVKNDLYRKKKLDLKLKIAFEHFFPFYIVSYDETDSLSYSKKIFSTVLDSIIGQTIAKSSFQDIIHQHLKEIDEDLNSMNELERNEYIQDFVTITEIESELTWDPIARKAAEIYEILSKNGITNTISTKFLSKPELPEIKDITDIAGLENKIKAWDSIEWHGCEVSFETPKGIALGRAFARNFEGMVSPITIVMNIAELLAFHNAATLNGIKISV